MFTLVLHFVVVVNSRIEVVGVVLVLRDVIGIFVPMWLWKLIPGGGGILICESYVCPDHLLQQF